MNTEKQANELNLIEALNIAIEKAVEFEESLREDARWATASVINKEITVKLMAMKKTITKIL